MSLATWSLNLLAAAAWLAVGITEHVIPGIALNVFSGITTIGILIFIAQCRRMSPLTPWAVLAASIVVTTAGFLVGGRFALGALGAGLSLSLYVPQVMTVFREPTTGVSLPTWVISLLSAILWGSYGLLTGIGAYIAGAIGMVPMAAIIVTKVATDRYLGRRHTSHNDGAATVSRARCFGTRACRFVGSRKTETGYH